MIDSSLPEYDHPSLSKKSLGSVSTKSKIAWSNGSSYYFWQTEFILVNAYESPDYISDANEAMSMVNCPYTIGEFNHNVKMKPQQPITEQRESLSRIQRERAAADWGNE